MLGNYELLSVIGRGGMGWVYRARHVLLDRPVAIKVLNPELAQDGDFVSRFFHEARIVNAARHPNIIDVADFLHLEAPRRVAYVMELLEGRPLSRALEAGAFSFEATVQVALQIVDALEAVHALGVVHRDLKPDNVFVLAGETPAVKVLDFGVAKTSGDAAHRTATGAIIGTPAYMAPEQISGDPVTAATDVYALGELMHEMRSGAALFSGTNSDILYEKVQGTLPPTQVYADPAEARLASLVRSCLHRRPEERPSLATVRSTLAALREGDVEVATPPRRVRWPIYALAGALSAAGVAAVLVGSGEPSAEGRPTTVVREGTQVDTSAVDRAPPAAATEGAATRDDTSGRAAASGAVERERETEAARSDALDAKPVLTETLPARVGEVRSKPAAPRAAVEAGAPRPAAEEPPTEAVGATSSPSGTSTTAAPDATPFGRKELPAW